METSDIFAIKLTSKPEIYRKWIKIWKNHQFPEENKYRTNGILEPNKNTISYLQPEDLCNCKCTTIFIKGHL